jgi:hypothetical protein
VDKAFARRRPFEEVKVENSRTIRSKNDIAVWWLLDSIHAALVRQEIEISQHAADAAADDNLSLVQLLEAVLVGIPVSKD